jgi:hypothetical protein
MEPHEVMEIVSDRRRLQSATEAIVDAKDLCARASLVVQGVARTFAASGRLA